MEQVGDMKFIDFEDALDRDLGKVGTPKRDAFESLVKPSGKLVLNRISHKRSWVNASV